MPGGRSTGAGAGLDLVGGRRPCADQPECGTQLLAFAGTERWLDLRPAPSVPPAPPRGFNRVYLAGHATRNILKVDVTETVDLRHLTSTVAFLRVRLGEPTEKGWMTVGTLEELH